MVFGTSALGFLAITVFLQKLLLSVRSHPVTSAADWERHIQAQEQDRLDELFPIRAHPRLILFRNEISHRGIDR